MSVTHAPAHTREQSLEALAIANDKRIGMARARREIGAMASDAAPRRAAEMIEDRDPRIGPMPIGRLLQSVPWIGRTKMLSLIRDAGIVTMDRRVDALTDRQVERLCASLRTWSRRRTKPAA
jgi:hypothetical protein